MLKIRTAPALGRRLRGCGRFVAEGLRRGRLGGGERGRRDRCGRRGRTGDCGGSRGDAARLLDGRRDRIATGIERHPHHDRPRRTHRVGVGHLLLDDPRHLGGPLLGHILHDLDAHRLDAFFGDKLADLHGHLANLLLRHHPHRLHRHFVFDPLDDLADRLHGYLANLLLGDHSHRLHRHLLHDLLVDIPHRLHRHLAGDDAVDHRRLLHLHRRDGRLIDAVDLVRDHAGGLHPGVAATLPVHQPVVGIDRVAAGHVSQGRGTRGDDRSDRIDRLAADGIGGAHLGDGLGHRIGLFALARLVDGTLHDAHLLLHRGLVDRLHDGEPLLTRGGFDDIAADVVAAVDDLRFIDRLHDGEPLFAILRLPHGALHGVAALLRLGFPDGLLHRVVLRVVDGLVVDAIRSHLLFVVDRLEVETVGLRRGGSGGGHFSTALAAGNGHHQRRLRCEHERRTEDRLHPSEGDRPGRVSTEQRHGGFLSSKKMLRD